MNINLIKKSDKDEWNKLVTEYAQMPFNIAFRILSDKEEAKDIAQDTFYNALKKINQFKSNTVPEFISWLRLIATNLALNKYKKKSKYKHQSLDEPFEGNEDEEVTLEETVASDTPTPLQGATKNEQIRAVHRIIEALPSNEKILYDLRYVKGLKNKEIATMLEKPLNTIKVYFFRLHNKIRQQLKQKDLAN